MTTNFLKLFSLLLVASLFFASCNKEELTPEEPSPTTEQNQNSGSNQINNLVASTTADSSGCYIINFPITFEYEDESTVTAESEEDLEEIFTALPLPVDIVFPINLIDPETNETASAANEEELEEYFENCDWDDEDDWDDEEDDEEDDGNCDDLDLEYGILDCYELVFPVSFILEDETVVTANTEDDLESIFFSENPPADFSYPLNLENEDGESVSAADEEALEDLLEECEDDDDDEWDENVVLELSFASISVDSVDFETCYTYVYPVNLVNADEEVVTANSDEEMFELLFSNQEIKDFDYPVQVTDNESGEVLTANEEDEAWELVEDCED